MFSVGYSSGVFSSQGLDMEFNTNEQGEVDFSSLVSGYPIPTTIDDWINLPIRDFDVRINTCKLSIRAPMVIITNYSKMNFHHVPINKRTVYDFYKARDIYTGKFLSFAEASLEHINPKSNNGKKTWKNIAITHKELNSERGNTPLTHWRYKLQYELKEPLPKPMCNLIGEIMRPEWLPFVGKYSE